MSDIVLEVSDLVKDYGKFRAVDKLSFKVPRGKIVGFLGPNGAGKTTTIQILLGITLLTSGEIKYFGKDFKKHKQEILKRINYSSAFNTLMGRISAWENMLVFADLYDIPNPAKRIKELVDYFEIGDIMSTRYWSLSSGQKTRVNLVKALINDPEMILMDEPTASLDPDIADKTLTLIEDLKKSRGLTILYTSHDMNEITRICDEVIFLDKGRIVAQDTPVGLTKRIKESELKIIFDGKKEDVEKVLTSYGEKFEFLDKNTVIITTDESLIPKVILEVGRSKAEITDLEIKKPSLEDVFLTIARKDKNGS
jgi:ABC-2 type transport system ATP-binding protein